MKRVLLLVGVCMCVVLLSTACGDANLDKYREEASNPSNADYNAASAAENGDYQPAVR